MKTIAPAATNLSYPDVKLARAQFGWTMYEFARAPSATLIFMFIFAPYFTQTVVGDPIEGVKYWGLANTIGGFAIACLAPFVGAIVDRMGRRIPWMIGAFLILATAESLLWFAMPGTNGGLRLGVIIALIAIIAFFVELSTLLHNAMLDSVGPSSQTGRASGRGYAMSNAGSLIAILLILSCVILPAQEIGAFAFLPNSPVFGLDPAYFEHERIVGPFVATWLLLFAIPFVLLTPDNPATGLSHANAVKEGMAQLFNTIRQARKVANVGRFLVGRMLYNDAIIALQVYSAIYGAGVFGWDSIDILAFAILLAISCAIGSMVAGHLDSRFGSRRIIIVANVAMSICIILMVSSSPGMILFIPMTEPDPLNALPLFSSIPEMFFLATFLVLGAVGSMILVCSRAMLAKISPLKMMTQFFGIYSLSGYATAFLGHALVSSVTGTTGSLQFGMLSTLILVAAGLAILFTVKETRAADLEVD